MLFSETKISHQENIYIKLTQIQFLCIKSLSWIAHNVPKYIKYHKLFGISFLVQHILGLSETIFFRPLG